MKIDKLSLIIITLLFSNAMMAQRLTKAEAESTMAELIHDWKEQLKERLRATNDVNCITQGDLKMKYTAQVFGEKPADGRSMWISMH